MAEGMHWSQWTPLVGRQVELGQLLDVLDQTGAGHGGVALVSGEPGIGKTRLVEELAERAGRTGAWVAWGRAHENEEAPPYWAWVELLGELLRRGDPEVIGHALGSTAGVIAAILPEIKELVPGMMAPPVLDPAQARFRLHQAVFDCLARLSRGPCLVVVLEDLHWADVASLDLTRFVAARLASARVLLVVTCRSVDGGVSKSFEDLLASLARQANLERVALSGLSQCEVARFIAQTVGFEPGAGAVSAVHARTEGNPFFVRELACLLASEGRFDCGPGSGDAPGAVPHGVRDVVRRRLARLPERTRSILACAAVIGRDFDLAILADAAGLAEAEALEVVEPARDEGLVIEDAASARKLRFSHALIRDTVYRELSGIGQATLHAQVGGAIERHSAAGSRVAELAGHFYQAAAVVGPEPGLGHLLAAAQSALAALAYDQAEDDLLRALSLIEQLPVAPERSARELDVQNRLVSVLTMTRGHSAPEVGRACARARQLCQELGEVDAVFTALSNLTGFHCTRGDLVVGAEFAGQLLIIGEQRSNLRCLTTGHFFLGLAQLYTGQLAAARDSFATLREEVQEWDLSTEVAESFAGYHPRPMALGYSALSAWVLGEEVEARAFVAEAVEVATRLDHPHTLAYAWYLAAQLEVLAGSVTVALKCSERAIAFCGQHRLTAYQSWFRTLRGWALSEQGRAEEGVAEMAAAVCLNRATGSQLDTPVCLGLWADGEARLGDQARALELVDEGLALCVENRLWESDLHRRYGELLGTQGSEHRCAAVEALRRGVMVAAAQGAVPFRQRAEAALAIVQQAEVGGLHRTRTGGCNLTPRERELVGLVGRGLTDKEIAAQLMISVATVHSHLDRVRDKTGCRRRSELTRLAVHLGLTSI